jgi:hypothetical protein
MVTKTPVARPAMTVGNHVSRVNVMDLLSPLVISDIAARRTAMVPRMPVVTLAVTARRAATRASVPKSPSE